MLLQISTLKFWINLEPLDYFRLIGTARGGRSYEPSVEEWRTRVDEEIVLPMIDRIG